MDALEQRAKLLLDIFAFEFIKEEVSLDLQAGIVSVVSSMLKETAEEAILPYLKKLKAPDPHQPQLIKVRRRTPR